MNDYNAEADERFMREALAEAAVAGTAGDVPVGCVIVSEGEIIARGHNRREASGDPTSHAEVEALRAASRHFGRWHIEGTLYVTQEPCPMCAGALVNSRIQRLVYGCKNPKAGAVDSVFTIVTDPRLNHRMPVMSGVLGDECAELLTNFFRAIRAERQANKT
ncbi:MAG: nucleoside deaminase [Myxococcales bacterium]|nr:nucleoside deaminase [Myxococcales bacterium]